MGWLAFASAAVSAYGAYSQSASAEDMSDSQRKLLRRNLDFQEERWNHFRETYGPLEQQFVKEAMQGYQPDYERIVEQAGTDVAQQFGNQREAEERRMAGLGVDPSSGAYVSSQRGLDMAEASTSALAQNATRNTARENAEQINFQRLTNAFGMGSGQGQSAAAGMGSATNNMASHFGNQAAMFNQNAGNLFEASGNFMGYGMSRNNQPDYGDYGNTGAGNQGYGQDYGQGSIWQNPFEEGGDSYYGGGG